MVVDLQTARWCCNARQELVKDCQTLGLSLVMSRSMSGCRCPVCCVAGRRRQGVCVCVCRVDNDDVEAIGFLRVWSVSRAVNGNIALCVCVCV